MLAAIEGPDILIVLAVVLLLFGSTQIPKLARSLGSASREFKRGQDHEQPPDVPTTAEPLTAAPVVAVAPAVTPVPAAPTTVAVAPVPNGSVPAAPAAPVPAAPAP
jgi:sec-independent protein translocase protein TatA